MATITAERLRRDISALLKGADLSQLSSKKIRKQLEDDYGNDLTERKKEIDAILMKLIEEKEEEDSQEAENSQNGHESSASDSDSEFEAPEDVGPPRKKIKTKQKATTTDQDLDMSCEDADDEEIAKKLQQEENTRPGRTRARSSGKRTTTPKSKSKAKGEKSEGSGKKRTSMYSRPCALSPLLAGIMGVEQMARSEVVKKMWEIIRERNLADPKNKQFMLCDAELLPVFGRKRVRTFGMMKYLKDHIFNQEEYDTMVLK